MKRFGFLLIALATVPLMGANGCGVYGSFYPVRGPLAEKNPTPVFNAKFGLHALDFRWNSPKVTLQLPNGETATGILYRCFPEPKKLPANLPGEMRNQWNQVYGQDSYASRVAGEGQDARGMLTGTSGTTLSMEIHETLDGPNRGAIKGVAQDNKGNLYKVTLGG